MSKKRELFRAGVSRGLESVDKKSEILIGYSVMSVGPALGHGVDIDITTLEQVIEHGNAKKNGLKSRFGHPNMSSEALGTFLGRSKNFRFSDDGQKALADLHIAESAHEAPGGDLAGYVMALAEEDPESFGASIVFEMSVETRMDEDNKPEKDESGNELPPLARVEALFASDVVDEPAANESGFFGHKFFNADVKLSAEATGFLNKFLEQPNAKEKIFGFLDKYFENAKEFSFRIDKDPKEEPTATGPAVETNQQEKNIMTPEEKAALVAEAQASALQRIKEIEALSLPGHEDLINKLKFDGKTTAGEAAVLILAAEKAKQASFAAAFTQDAPLPLQDQPSKEVVVENFDHLPVDERCKKEWSKSKVLQKEFMDDFETYLAFEKANEDGQVRYAGVVGGTK